MIIRRFSLPLLALAISLQSFGSFGAEQPKAKPPEQPKLDLQTKLMNMRQAAAAIYQHDIVVLNAMVNPETGQPTYNYGAAFIRESYSRCRTAVTDLEAIRRSRRLDSVLRNEADILLKQATKRLGRADLCRDAAKL